MSASTAEQIPQAAESSLLFVGNPNVGKSVLFGVLTGTYATVSNYPGTTVELSRGQRRGGKGWVYDLPGTNSLLPNSEDEQVTRDVLLDHLGRAATAPGSKVEIIQVCDAKNLRRGLVLSLQLAELEAPMVFVANMLDEARSRHVDVNLSALETTLGVPVLGTVATRRQGLGKLQDVGLGYRASTARVHYGELIEEGIRRVSEYLPSGRGGKRGLALMLLAGDRSLLPWARQLLKEKFQSVQDIQADIARRTPEPLRFAISRARLAAADAIVERVLTTDRRAQSSLVKRLGDAAMHPIWGVPIALATLYLTYLFVGVLGAGEAVDFFESVVFGDYLVPWSDAALRWLLPASIEPFFVGPVGVEAGTGPGLLIGEYGLISMALSYSVAIVLPIVGFFFIAFSIMEDSGYLPRLAVMLNRVFKLIGLNGKAVLPMVLGLGCATMATMTARILPTRKERLLVSILLALGIPCSAQLGVILGMLAGLEMWGTVVWVGVVTGVMLLVGVLANKVLPGRSGDFVLEVPPLRRPQLANTVIKTLARVEWYLKEAVPLFIVATFVLWILDRLDFLSTIQRLASPLVVGFLGLPAKATDAFLVGFLRRDYGAAGLYALFSDKLAAGNLNTETQIQIIVSMVTITLFVPCVANVLMLVKERGAKAGIFTVAFIFPFAIVVGGLLNQVLRALLLP